MEPSEWRREVARTAWAAGVTVLLMFLLWAAAEDVLRPGPAGTRQLHLFRGLSTSAFAAAVVTIVGWRQHRKPVLMVGGYGQFTFHFNYWGPTGVNRDTHVRVRKMPGKAQF